MIEHFYLHWQPQGIKFTPNSIPNLFSFYCTKVVNHMCSLKPC